MSEQNGHVLPASSSGHAIGILPVTANLPKIHWYQPSELLISQVSTTSIYYQGYEEKGNDHESIYLLVLRSRSFRNATCFANFPYIPHIMSLLVYRIQGERQNDEENIYLLVLRNRSFRNSTCFANSPNPIFEPRETPSQVYGYLTFLSPSTIHHRSYYSVKNWKYQCIHMDGIRKIVPKEIRNLLLRLYIRHLSLPNPSITSLELVEAKVVRRIADLLNAYLIEAAPQALRHATRTAICATVSDRKTRRRTPDKFTCSICHGSRLNTGASNPFRILTLRERDTNSNPIAGMKANAMITRDDSLGWQTAVPVVTVNLLAGSGGIDGAAATSVVHVCGAVSMSQRMDYWVRHSLWWGWKGYMRVVVVWGPRARIAFRRKGNYKQGVDVTMAISKIANGRSSQSGRVKEEPPWLLG
ncbi:hypothetical protein FPV67DRAFT_1446955 [Lyophyllum atratum]|nr:hypothetical protein FPV67DRAFT_1446955 [Lyophyllum atratum]